MEELKDWIVVDPKDRETNTEESGSEFDYFNEEYYSDKESDFETISSDNSQEEISNDESYEEEDFGYETDSEDELFEQNRQRVIEILQNNPKFCDLLGIKNFDENKIEINEEGFLDKAVYKDGDKVFYLKLSSCEGGEVEYGNDMLVDYICFSILKRFGCNVPEVYICKYGEEDGVNKYLFASKGVENVFPLKSILFREDITIREDVRGHKKDLLKTLLVLYILGAQDLNGENLMIDGSGRIVCIDANFEAFYERNIAEDEHAKQYNSLQENLDEHQLSGIASMVGFDFVNQDLKAKRLLMAINYLNQLSRNFDEFNKKGKLVFPCQLSKVILNNNDDNNRELNDVVLDEILQEMKSVGTILYKDLKRNAYNLNEAEKEITIKTLQEIEDFAKGQLQFFRKGFRSISPSPVCNKNCKMRTV